MGGSSPAKKARVNDTVRCGMVQAVTGAVEECGGFGNGPGRYRVKDMTLRHAAGGTHAKFSLQSAAGWKKYGSDQAASEEEMRDVLKSVQRLWIRGEYRDGPDVGKLDNVRLEQ